MFNIFKFQKINIFLTARFSGRKLLDIIKLVLCVYDIIKTIISSCKLWTYIFITRDMRCTMMYVGNNHVQYLAVFWVLYILLYSLFNFHHISYREKECSHTIENMNIKNPVQNKILYTSISTEWNFLCDHCVGFNS